MIIFGKKISDFAANVFIENKKVILGLDIGDKTVGIAVSDRGIKIATGITTLKRKGNDEDYAKLIETFENYDIGLIVCGWPVQMNGMPGAQCQKIYDFIEKLSEYLSLDFVQWDERFSTKVVEKVMIKTGVSRKKRKENIDKIAAIYILQGAIDSLNITKQEIDFF